MKRVGELISIPSYVHCYLGRIVSMQDEMFRAFRPFSRFGSNSVEMDFVLHSLGVDRISRSSVLELM